MFGFIENYLYGFVLFACSSSLRMKRPNADDERIQQSLNTISSVGYFRLSSIVVILLTIFY